jgi:hypothetical protein
MSLGKLFLSGLLIAGGLILAAFTLHGYFDPQWAQRQAQAAGARERPKELKAINTFQGRSRFVASRPEQPSPGARPPAATPAVAANPNAFVKAADTKPAVKSPVKKKVAEKPKPQPQQASVWPWNLFSN